MAVIGQHDSCIQQHEGLVADLSHLGPSILYMHEHGTHMRLYSVSVLVAAVDHSTMHSAVILEACMAHND